MEYCLAQMEHFDIIMSMIGILFLAIIGVYGWTIKIYKDTNMKLGEVYKEMNHHHQQANIHASADKFVPIDVCKALHEHMAADVKEIKADVKAIIRSRNSG